MHYIIEALIVGLYTVCIFIMVNIFITDMYLQLFITGFIKHLLGYYSGIHDWYCNNGYACINKNHIKLSTDSNIIRNSIFEGIIFLIIGNLLLYIIGKLRFNIVYIIFTIGVILHLAFELFNIHKFYCINYCNAKL
jgi:hypothetical protein